jgi:hypothetical protein
MSYRERQLACKARGLPATGKGDALLQRLLGTASEGSGKATEGMLYQFSTIESCSLTLPTLSDKLPKKQAKWTKSEIKAHMLESLALGDTDSDPYWTLKPAEVWASDERFKETPKRPCATLSVVTKNQFFCTRKALLLRTMPLQSTLRNSVGRHSTIGGKQSYTNIGQTNYWSLMLLRVKQMGKSRKKFSKIAQSITILI